MPPRGSKRTSKKRFAKKMKKKAPRKIGPYPREADDHEEVTKLFNELNKLEDHFNSKKAKEVDMSRISKNTEKLEIKEIIPLVGISTPVKPVRGKNRMLVKDIINHWKDIDRQLTEAKVFDMYDDLYVEPTNAGLQVYGYKTETDEEFNERQRKLQEIEDKKNLEELEAIERKRQKDIEAKRKELERAAAELEQLSGQKITIPKLAGNHIQKKIKRRIKDA